MASLSLLEDCQNCISKGQDSWNSYFSKWEVLAKQEENVSENELLDELYEDIALPNSKKKKKLNKQATVKAESLKLSQTTKKTIRKKNIRTSMKEKEKRKKKKERTRKVIERPPIMGNENLPEDSSNEQMELDLRTIFINILKANKNKWEMFGVLSQTFSHEGLTVKNSHHFILNQHLALAPNDVDLDNRGFLFGNMGFSLAPPNTPREILPRNSFSFKGFNQNSNRMFKNHLGFVDRPKPCLGGDNIVNRRLTIDRFSFGQKSIFMPMKIGSQTSPASQVEFRMRLLQSCPSKIFSLSHLNSSAYRRNKMLKPLALDFGNKYTAGERSKINNEYLVRNEETGSQRAADIFREKSFHNLCLHKRTNDVSLNMENSNFITPKRKPPERKCFSENILQRKRRRPSKLAFFGNEEEEESDDDEATENRSPVIRWQCKKRKTEIITESDSDECESILDRINHEA